MKILFQPAGKRCFKWPSNGSEALALNLGTGRSYSILRVVSAIERVTGHPVPVTFNHLAESIQTHNATIHGLPFVTGFPSAINHSSILYNRILFPGCLCICSEQPEWLDRRSGISAFAVPEFCNLLPRDLYRNDSQVRCNNARPRLPAADIGRLAALPRRRIKRAWFTRCHERDGSGQAPCRMRLTSGPASSKR
jgi:hypothetical protein